jgi:hypothetical protein
MKKLSASERRLAAIFITLLVLALFWQVGVRLLWQRLQKANETLQQREKLIAETKPLAAELPGLESDNKKLAGQRQLLLISGETVPEMILLVGDAAKTAKVGEVAIRPLPAETVNGYLRQPMQLECKAAFLQIKDFLYYLEQGGNPLLVERLEISREKQGATLQARLSVVGFALAEAEGENK